MPTDPNYFRTMPNVTLEAYVREHHRMQDEEKKLRRFIKEKFPKGFDPSEIVDSPVSAAIRIMQEQAEKIEGG